MTNFARIGFPRGVGRDAPWPVATVPPDPRDALPLLPPLENDDAPVRRIPWVGMPLEPGYDDIPFQ